MWGVTSAVTADVTPHMVTRAGVAVRVLGLSRFYALLVASNRKVQLVKKNHHETILAEAAFDWSLGQTLEMKLAVSGEKLTGSINGVTVLEASDSDLPNGAAGLIVEEGRTATEKVVVSPFSS